MTIAATNVTPANPRTDVVLASRRYARRSTGAGSTKP